MRSPTQGAAYRFARPSASDARFDLVAAIMEGVHWLLESPVTKELTMLLPCPFCDNEVIEGADACDACGQPLTESHLPVPATPVERALLSDRVKIFQGRQPMVVSPSMPVREVLRLMVDNKVGCVLVADQGKMAGIFTERDVLLKVGEQAAELGGRPVSEFMTSKVESLPPSAKIAFAVHRMDQGGYRHVPVVNEQGEAVGIFSVRDILSYLTRKLAAAK
jgi:CBS domain-containing protein